MVWSSCVAAMDSIVRDHSWCILSRNWDRLLIVADTEAATSEASAFFCRLLTTSWAAARASAVALTKELHQQTKENPLRLLGKPYLTLLTLHKKSIRMYIVWAHYGSIVSWYPSTHNAIRFSACSWLHQAFDGFGTLHLLCLHNTLGEQEANLVHLMLIQKGGQALPEPNDLIG